MATPSLQFPLERSRLVSHRIIQLLFAGVSLTIVAMTLLPIARGDRAVLEVLLEAAMPAFLLVLVLLIALRHERRWTASVKAMSHLLSEIREGEARSEDLKLLGEQSHELAQLAERIATLCRDLKSHKQAVAALEAEIQKRVATRTDSLERKLGALREKVHRDALTGLSNRGAFDSVFPAMFEEARKEQADLCVIMIDVDNFKDLNDTLGHWAGDDYLRKVGQLIRAAVRERDQAFRYGGDEFVLVLWNTSAAAGKATAKRLCRLSEELSRNYAMLARPRLSCGVASMHETRAVSQEELLRLADEGLYRLKNARKAEKAAA